MNCYNNDYKIQEINCQIFLMHGKKDDIISYKKSESLIKLNNRILDWFPSKGTNNNFFDELREKFYNKCSHFLDQLKYFQKEIHNNSDNYSSTNIKSLLKINENYIKASKNDYSSLSFSNNFLMYSKLSPETKSTTQKENYQKPAFKLIDNDKDSTSQGEIATLEQKNQNIIIEERENSEDTIKYVFSYSGPKTDQNLNLFNNSFSSESVDIDMNEKMYNMIKKDY